MNIWRIIIIFLLDAFVWLFQAFSMNLISIVNNENGVNHFGYTGAFNHNRLHGVHFEATGSEYQLYNDRGIEVIHQSSAVHTQGALTRTTNKIRYTSEELKKN